MFFTFEQLFYLYTAFIVLLVFLLAVFFFLKRLKKKKDILASLELVLFEITLPLAGRQKKENLSYKELISTMEQLYAGLASILEDKMWFRSPRFSLEIALPSVGEETTFFVAVPRKKSRLFEKHLQSLYPSAKVLEKKDDYNVFNSEGETAGGVFRLARTPLLPIRTYQRLDTDPLEVISNSFAKLKKEGEGAALQIIMTRGPKNFAGQLKSALKTLREGKEIKEEKGWGRTITQEAKFIAFGETKKRDDSPRPIDEETVKLIEEKTGFPVFNSEIRLVASAKTREEAEGILQELSSAFEQFSETRGNALEFKLLKGKALERLIYRFSFRLPYSAYSLPLNSRELTSVYHFPSVLTTAPKLKSLKAKDAPAPSGLPAEGLLLGENVFRGETTPARISEDDRRRHLYVVGQTGTGKTTFLKNMIKQDIETGRGLCVIDPHGDMVEEVLGYVPESRLDDLIYFDPANTARPMALNFLEYDPRYPEQKSFIVNELLEIFRKLYADVPEALGPVFETYFRNATMLVMEDPSSGNTLLDIARVMSDAEYRALKLSRSKNPVINAFWKDVAEKAGGEASLANMVPYITSKFDSFTANDYMRPILLQEHSSLKFREIMDSGKILLVNLSKGRVGETNASLLGLIIVGKILMASLSRVDIAENERRDFYLYLDEFQNVTTPSIATILSEARKYRLGLIIAHQFIGQLSEPIKLAVFGNVGSIVSFRVGADDAEYLAKQFAPVFEEPDLMNIENFNAYVKMLLSGQTARPFNIRIFPSEKGNEASAASLKELSAHKYGRPLEEVEAEIKKRYPQ